ncbi:MAG TPA: sugar phosphate nucleotidyltransferase [Candidatus Binataceae bacterium]|nr:sugar phosphate nucleotidyltransferase [Candidatus Binataceae bacterium]
MPSIKTATEPRAAIILAGGDGRRLRPLTRRITGFEIPKQFCPILGEETLLSQTRRRVSLMFKAAETMLLLNSEHEDLFASQIAGLPEMNLLVQPTNRGTAAGILYSLLRAADRGAEVVAFFPSDHYISDDERFMRHVEVAFDAVHQVPGLTVMLGVPAEGPEVQYGWIEPAGSTSMPTPLAFHGLRGIRRFWEKPSQSMAEQLYRRGCLWNSFVMVSRVSNMLELFRRSVPELYRKFDAVWTSLGTRSEQRVMRSLYPNLPSVGFSTEILERFSPEMGVLPIRGVEWSDLGEPARVIEILARRGLSPAWLQQA